MDNGREEQALNGNGKPHQWELFKSETQSDENRPRQGGKPVPGNDNLIITSRGKTADKRRMQNLKQGGSPGRGGKNGEKKLPDLNEALIRVLSEEKDGKQALEIILQSMRAKATRGSEKAADLLLNRAYGSHLMRLDEGMIIQPTEPITGFNINTAHEERPNIERETD